MAGEKTPKEHLVPFSYSEYEKAPHRLRHYSGYKALSVVEQIKGFLVVEWDFDANKHNRVVPYDLNSVIACDKLKLMKDEFEAKIRIWRGPQGQPVIWANFQSPAVTQEFPETLQLFNGWLSEEITIKLHGVNLNPEIAQSSHATYMVEPDDMYKVPRGDVFVHWAKALEKNPEATVKVRHMLWFFGGTAETLNARAEMGKVPKAVPALPGKHHRKWRLADVADFKGFFVGAAKGTLKVASG